MISPFDKLLSLKIKLGDDRNFFSAVEKTCSSRDEHFKYFLDSSKDPRRLVRLEQIFGKDNIVVIHLVRDIRGYVAVTIVRISQGQSSGV